MTSTQFAKVIVYMAYELPKQRALGNCSMHRDFKKYYLQIAMTSSARNRKRKQTSEKADHENSYRTGSLMMRRIRMAMAVSLVMVASKFYSVDTFIYSLSFSVIFFSFDKR